MDCSMPLQPGGDVIVPGRPPAKFRMPDDSSVVFCASSKLHAHKMKSTSSGDVTIISAYGKIVENKYTNMGEVTHIRLKKADDVEDFFEVDGDQFCRDKECPWVCPWPFIISNWDHIDGVRLDCCSEPGFWCQCPLKLLPESSK